MAKGDDAIRKKKNKVLRKRMRNDSSSAKVSSRIAGIIASKQRRKAGKRRMCEGMCFSLPTPEDPFNDRQTEKVANKKPRKLEPPQADVGTALGKDAAAPRRNSSGRNSVKAEVDQRNPKKDKFANGKHGQKKNPARKDQTSAESGIPKGGIQENGGVDHIHKQGHLESLDVVPKYLKLCLNAIHKALLDDCTSKVEEYRPQLFEKWGVEFLDCCQYEIPILETTGACFSREQIAWVVSTAANVITHEEKQGLSISNPFLLILVANQEKAIQVRSVCKPLKALGIHTVSLHGGASLDHQIHGLKGCDPEFLIATPERLLELVSLKAIDLSGLYFLSMKMNLWDQLENTRLLSKTATPVVDGLETFAKEDLLDILTSVRQSISRDTIHEVPKTLIFCDNLGTLSTSVVKKLVSGPICRLSRSDSIASQSACITQCVHVCALEERVLKAIGILDEQVCMRIGFAQRKVLFVEGSSSKAQSLAVSLAAKGYFLLKDAFSDGSGADSRTREKPDMVTITDLEHVGRLTNMENFDLIFILQFSPSVDDYVQILTNMARYSLDAELHSFLGQEDIPLAGPLIDVLTDCGQTVPDSLK